MIRTSEAAFETVIEAQLLAHGCVPVAGEAFDRERTSLLDAASSRDPTDLFPR